MEKRKHAMVSVSITTHDAFLRLREARREASGLPGPQAAPGLGD